MSERETETTELREVSTEEWIAKSRRSFLTMGLSAFAGFVGWKWLHSASEQGGLPAPLRAGHRWNENLSRKLFDPRREDLPNQKPEPGARARLNGDLGLRSPIETEDWRLSVESPEGGRSLQLRVDELKKLPDIATHTEFRCIEGWSEFITYSGYRFSDFMTTFGVGTKSGRPYSPATPRSDLFDYVALETPDGEYYVSIDMESMLHAQTFLATGMNGRALDEAHGAPLRLIIPIKYGIKSLKRIGRIYFSDERPPDFWAERGYDWYSGL